MDVVPNLDENSLPVSSDEEPTIGQRKRVDPYIYAYISA